MPGGLSHLADLLARVNPLDWCIAAVLIASTVLAFLRGLIRSVVSLAGAVLGVVLACVYAPVLAPRLAAWVHPVLLAQAVAFGAILLAVYCVTAVLGRLLRGACSAVGLGFMDRLGGACFGFARGVLVLSAMLLPLLSHLSAIPQAGGSVLLSYLLPVAHGISFVMPRDFRREVDTGDWLRAKAPGHFPSMVVRPGQQNRGEHE